MPFNRFLPFSLILILFTLFPGSGLTQPSDKIPTNLELLGMNLDSCLKAISTEGLLRPGDNVKLEVITIDSAFASFQHFLLRQKLMSDHGVSVKTNDSPGSDHSKKIRFRWIEWRIDYAPIKRRFWRKTSYQRNQIADLFVEVEDQDNAEVLFANRFRFLYEDKLGDRQLAEVQNNELSFTIGQIDNSKPALHRWLEPAFLFAISGAVVYIFYAVRSE